MEFKTTNEEYIKGKIIDEKRFLTPVGFLSYPFLYTPYETKPTSIKPNIEYWYKTEILFNKDIVDLSLLREAIDGFGKSKFKDYPKLTKRPIKDADFTTDEKIGLADKYDWATNCFHFESKNRPEFKPKIIDINKNDISGEPEMIYSGCYARLLISFYSYTKDTSRGIGLNLHVVQKIQDGTVLKTGKSVNIMDVF